MKVKAVLFGFITLLACNAFAGVTEGKLSTVFVHGFNDVFAFRMQSSSPNFASCATSMRYAVSTSTQQGKNILSTILAAKAAGQTIQVVGKNTCTTHSDAEDIHYVVVY